jgi:SHS2 domain-containing protein
MPYEYLEDVATADIAFRAWDEVLENLFITAADATMNVMVEQLDSIRPLAERDIALEDSSLEMLLFNFLHELIYYKDAATLLLRVPQVRINEKNNGYTLQAKARGETLEPERHLTRVDVKAITMHRFSLMKRDDLWEAFVILDI